MDFTQTINDNLLSSNVLQVSNYVYLFMIFSVIQNIQKLNDTQFKLSVHVKAGHPSEQLKHCLTLMLH